MKGNTLTENNSDLSSIDQTRPEKSVSIALFTPDLSIVNNASVNVQMNSGPIRSMDVNVNTDIWWKHSVVCPSSQGQDKINQGIIFFISFIDNLGSSIAILKSPHRN